MNREEMKEFCAAIRKDLLEGPEAGLWRRAFGLANVYGTCMIKDGEICEQTQKEEVCEKDNR